ncbi:MAG TPA: NUDIX hydrolase, partial [Candidatus Paceibacterota bacterium]|nr:NUDIX hydrolase [Candidatus Paceibacterota bacterium]
RVLESTHFTCDTPVEEVFGDQTFLERPTIAGLIINGGAMLMVQPTKVRSEKEERQWIPPQGGVKFGADGDETLLTAALREFGEELGLTTEHLVPRKAPELIGHCRNPIPAERGESFEFKRIFFIVMHARSRDWVKLNGENRKYLWVDSGPYLLSLIGSMFERRETKFQAICAATVEAHKRGMLPWDCRLEPAPA